MPDLVSGCDIILEMKKMQIRFLASILKVLMSQKDMWKLPHMNRCAVS